MFKVNAKLNRQILESLSNSYPRYVFPSQILPGHKDQTEIENHLVYCSGHGWIELEQATMSDGSVKLGRVRISSLGLSGCLCGPIMFS